jgi:hypothetical protein
MSRADFAAVMAFLLDHKETERMVVHDEGSLPGDVKNAKNALKHLEGLIESAQDRFLSAEQGDYEDK